MEWNIMKLFLKVFGLFFLLFVSGTVLLLSFQPPELLRVGTGYAAKIICSNVFIAGRDENAVLTADVQAPGNPLLKFLNISVDHQTGTVTARIFGFFAPSKAVFRKGVGCANIQSVDERLTLDNLDPPELHFAETDINAKIQRVIENPQLSGPGMRAVAVFHNGQVIAETYADGFDADTPLLGWSATKSVMATLIGMRIADKHMDLSHHNLLPEWSHDDRSNITLGQLMAMESGLRFDEDYGTVTDVTRMLFLETDMAGFAASLPLQATPGSKFNYSSGTANILSKLFMESFETREQALAYPYEALFKPLGMTHALLETDASGVFAGSSYMYATAREWARFGGLLADNGKLHGKQLIPAAFVSFMRKPAASSEGRYGSAQVWLRVGARGAVMAQFPDDAFWMLGHDGQSIMIVPSLRLAVVRLGLTPSRTGYDVRPLQAAVIEALK